MLLNVDPAVHHLPPVNSMGQPSATALSCSLTHRDQDVKRKEGKKSQWGQPTLKGEKNNQKRMVWGLCFSFRKDLLL